MKIIVDRYIKLPKEILDGKDIWVGESDETNIIFNFMSYFILTNNEKNKVYNNELQQLLKQKQKGVSLQKLV